MKRNARKGPLKKVVQSRKPDQALPALETLELVTKQMAAAVTRCSSDLRYIWANQAYADWIQRPLNEVVGHPIADVLGNEAFQRLRRHFERALSGERVTHEEEINFHGIGRRCVSVTYTPTFDGSATANGWVGVVIDVTERKRAEEARFRHAAIVESSEDAIISKDLDAIITSWNAGAEHMFGYREEEVIGQPITILIPPDLRNEEHTILARLRTEGRIEHYETRRISRTGKQLDVSLTISPIKDSTGRLVGFSKIARDITQRKQAEKAVKESEQRFQLVADTAPVLIWMSGTDKLCNYFNKPWLDFTGRSLENELGSGWAEGVHPDDRRSCLDTYTQFFERQEKFRMEYRLRRYDGEYRWVLDIGVPRFNPDRSFAGYIGIAVDVTERRRTQETLLQLNRTLESQTAELQAREELLKIFVKNVPVGAAMFDREMRYLQVSDRWCTDYMVDRSQVLGRSHYDLFPDMPDRWKQVHHRAFAGETVRAEEDRWDREDGTKWVRWEVRPWLDLNGRPGGILIFAEDISRRKQMEESLSDMSRKLIQAHEEERSRIARELHDDISQRVALLAINLHTLKRGLPNSQKKASDEIEEICERVGDLGRDIGELSHRLHSSKLEYVGLVTAAVGFCKEFSMRQGVETTFHSEDIPADIPADAALCLFRVLQEALQNAAKHSGVKQFEVSLKGSLKEIDLTVRDSGVGFDTEKVMNEFGLGLTSMHERLKLAGGHLLIDSKLGRGTTIRASVPRSSSPACLEVPKVKSARTNE